MHYSTIMNRFLIAASAATITPSASATATGNPIRFERDAAHIDYRDLDLTSHNGRAQLVGRIRKAAERICADYDGGVPSFSKIGQCYRVLVRDGIEQMDKIAPAMAKSTPKASAITSNAMAQGRQAVVSQEVN